MPSEQLTRARSKDAIALDSSHIRIYACGAGVKLLVREQEGRGMMGLYTGLSLGVPGLT